MRSNSGYTPGRVRDPERAGLDDSISSSTHKRRSSSSGPNYCLYGIICCVVTTIIIVAVVLICVFWNGLIWEKDYEVHNSGRASNNNFNNPGPVVVQNPNYVGGYPNGYNNFNPVLAPGPVYPNNYGVLERERELLAEQQLLNQQQQIINQQLGLGGGINPLNPVYSGGVLVNGVPQQQNSDNARNSDYVVKEREGFIPGK